MPVKVVLGKDLFDVNQKTADELRKVFHSRDIRVVNLLSSPGAGKTSLLEKVIPVLSDMGVAVIEGDVETTRDAERLATLGIQVVQITTLGACHLDAAMISRALGELDLSRVRLLFIENVGNLVCPASFDLGEDLRIVVLSVAEGSDKPSKYPKAFLTSQAVVINKIDLLPFVDFELDAVTRDIAAMVPSARVFNVSCKTGLGLTELCQWLREWFTAKSNPA